MSCGTTLTGAAPGREARKVVTVVFADITGSTGLGEHLDPESLRSIMGRWFEAMRAVLEGHGGTVEKFIGDAVVAVFGVPVLHEDDALRAVRAAIDMSAALVGLNAALGAERGLAIQMRVGINTGQVVVGDARAGGSRATGDAVNVAARLQGAAEPGEILLGDSTWRMVRDGAVTGEPREIKVKGRDEPVVVRSLISVDQSAEAIHRRIGGPMVGRDRELGILRAAFERTVAEERCVLVTVLGSAGVGKSRLVQEFLDEARAKATVLSGRCLPYGQTITWHPVAELLRSAVDLDETATPALVLDRLGFRLAGIPDADAIVARLGELLGAGAQAETGPVEELFWAVRRLVERLAAQGPVILVIDDLQWAEPAFLDLVEHLADWVQAVPVLLLGMARPELLDLRPGWGGGKPDATTFLLEPLPAAETERLVAALLEGGTLEPAARARIAAAADGNPLFVEQVIEMLLDDGVVRRKADGQLEIGNLETISVPPTIQALLAARLDRLSEPERRTIERASVVGKEFGQLDVSELTPAESRPNVAGQLMALVRKELIRPDRRRDDGAETYRFRHLLIRDAAYESLPKAERAELHERFADWLERTTGARLVELDEITGYHLDQARAYRLDLGPEDDHTRALAMRAGRRLAAAGRRTADREEVASAIRLLSRAEALLVEDPRARFDVLMRLVDVVFSQDYPTAMRAARQAEAVGAQLGPLAVRRAQLWIASIRAMSEPAFIVSGVQTEAEASIGDYEKAGDIEGVLDCFQMLVVIQLNLAHWTAAVRWARRGMERAAEAGLERQRSEFAASIANAVVWGSTPIAEGLATVDALLAATGRRAARSLMLSTRAVLLGLAGDRPGFEAALGEATTIRNELGLPPLFFRSAYAEYGLDNLDGAVHTARQAAADLERRGETGARSTMLGLSSWVLVLQGKDDEALAAAAEARRLGAEDDAVTQIQWRSTSAVVLARRGDPDEADRLSLEALSISAGTDSIDAATAWLARSMTLAILGRAAEASAAATNARDLAAAKGSVNIVRRAEALIRD